MRDCENYLTENADMSKCLYMYYIICIYLFMYVFIHFVNFCSRQYMHVLNETQRDLGYIHMIVSD